MLLYKYIYKTIVVLCPATCINYLKTINKKDCTCDTHKTGRVSKIRNQNFVIIFQLLKLYTCKFFMYHIAAYFHGKLIHQNLAKLDILQTTNCSTLLCKHFNQTFY